MGKYMMKKDEVIMQGNTKNGVTQYTRSSEIRLADLLSDVNSKGESFTEINSRTGNDAAIKKTRSSRKGILKTALPNTLARLQ